MKLLPCLARRHVLRIVWWFALVTAVHYHEPGDKTSIVVEYIGEAIIE